MGTVSCIERLRDYIAIPSVNPMGRSDVPEAIAGEARYAEEVRQNLRRLGLDAELLGDPSRPSVLAEARTEAAIDTVLFASHLDTVPVDGMEIDPFDPVIQGGRVYGRGACDTKSGMAALLAALERVLERGTLRRNVIVVGEADEELGGTGARDVLAHLEGRQTRPDWALATEPTDLRLVTHHKGVALARLVAHGRACHSSDPGAGRNAIVSLARAVLALEELAADLAGRKDPRLGPATLSVGRTAGGQAPNIVPDQAWLQMDRRLLPSEDPEQVRAEIEDALKRNGIEDVEIESCRIEKGALGTPDNHPAVRACRSALEGLGISGESAAVAFGTDAGIFAQEGLPGVVLGPGSIAQAHTVREYVEISQVETAVEIFVSLLEART